MPFWQPWMKNSYPGLQVHYLNSSRQRKRLGQVLIGGFHVTSSPPCWWTVNERSFISSFCLSTSICSFHHCYLCLLRLDENHLSRNSKVFKIYTKYLSFLVYNQVYNLFVCTLYPCLTSFLQWNWDEPQRNSRSLDMSRGTWKSRFRLDCVT